MSPLRYKFLTLIFLLLPLGAMASEESKTKMLGNLDFIKNTFKVQYAPLDWKESSGWNLESAIDKAKLEVHSNEAITVKGFQKIVKSFFNSVGDYHVGVTFYSTESSSLPFKIKRAENRFFFTYIDRARLSSTVYPIREGDELISFNGVPIAEAFRDFLEKEIDKGNNPTSQALAEIYFSLRLGSDGHYVPKGPVMISVKPRGSSKIHSYQLIWEYRPEEIKGILPQKFNSNRMMMAHTAAYPMQSAFTLPLGNNEVFKKLMVNPHYLKWHVDEPRKGNHEMGAKLSYIPTLGAKTWEADPLNSFYAYTFVGPNDAHIGYIRIPHYMSEGNEVNDFKDIISYFQGTTDALIIDQINNPGGSLFYLYALASMLTDQPLYAPRHKMSITQKEVAFALEVIPVLESISSDVEAEIVLGEAMEGNPVTYQSAQFFLTYFRFILDEWNQGHTFTSPTHLWGIDHINPHPDVQYTKPILVIVNNLDFSGGDFFPVIMQDNNRATIFGAKTAGAGGFVLSAEFPNLFGIKNFHYTASLAERENSAPIESLGVTPDVPYELTVHDLQNQYSDYAHAILQAVIQILEQKK